MFVLEWLKWIDVNIINGNPLYFLLLIGGLVVLAEAVGPKEPCDDPCGED